MIKFFFFHHLFQVIIIGSWIFSLIFNTPIFLMIKVEGNACVNVWVYGGDWIPKAYYLIWSAMVVLAVVLMAGLYSRIVYTLWFKRDIDQGNELTFQQRVSCKKQIQYLYVSFTSIFCGFLSDMFPVCRPPDSDVTSFGFASLFIHRAL